MDSIKDILNFNFNADAFAKMGSNVVSIRLMQNLNKKTAELKYMSCKFDSYATAEDKSIDIDCIINEINRSDQLPNFPTRKEKRILRAMCFHLSEINNETMVADVLQSINKKWSNSFFSGLIYTVFQFWEPVSSKFRKIRDLLKDKLLKYNGSIPRYKFLHDNINYIDDNGPVTLGVMLKAKNESIWACTKVFDIPEQSINNQYFSDVIFSYYRYKFTKYVNYDELRKVLEQHNMSLTDKSVIPLFIVKSEDVSTLQKEKLENLAKSRIGDCENNALWSLPTTVDSERQERIKQAQDLMRLWTNEKCISTYFKICVDDMERKQFWIKHINEIERIRIAGSRVTKQLMDLDPRLSKLLDGHFILSTINTKKLTSAIVMKIRNKVYVEFSEKGNALYVYQEDRLPIDNLFSLKDIPTAISGLKLTSMGPLIDAYFDCVNESGTVRHSGEWEYRLSNYICTH